MRFLPSTVTEKNVPKNILDGRTEGRTEGRKDGMTDGRTEGWTDRRTEVKQYTPPPSGSEGIIIRQRSRMVNTYHKPFIFPLLLETSEAHMSLCLLT